MKIVRATKAIIQKNLAYHKKFCIYCTFSSYGCETLHYNSPIATCKTYPKAVAKLKELAKSSGRYIILQYLDNALGKTIIQNEGRLPKKEYAVFSTDYKGDKTKAHYYWGTIKGVDRHHAMSILEITGFYDSKYRCIFLHILKDGKLLKNPFPHTPILEINEKNRENNVTISNIKTVPLKKIIQNGKRTNLS